MPFCKKEKKNSWKLDELFVIIYRSMEYIVFKTGGKQYKVSVGDQIEVDKIKHKDKKAVFDSVMLWVLNGEVKIGKPFITDIRLVAKITGDKKGAKLRVARFKAKARYRKVTGFRPYLTMLEIEKIEVAKKAKTPQKN